MSTVFEHANVLHSTDTNTSIFLQVSVRNPDATSLRFAIGSVMFVANAAYTRTNAQHRMASASGAGSNNSNNYDMPNTFKPQQLQEVHVAITKIGEQCILRVGFSAVLPSASPVIQMWRCFSDDVFSMHGQDIVLHSVVLQVNNQRQAIWDFTTQTPLSLGAPLCAECPVGTTLNPNTRLCTQCYTGFRINVNETSEWWSTSPQVAPSVVVPAPDWAVLKVGGTRQNTGIMRHSSTTTNGNMILTPSNKVYAYEEYDSVPRVCREVFETRVRQTPNAQNTCEVHILFKKGVTVILMNWKAGLDNSVRTYLSMIETWSVGDTAQFCEHSAQRSVLDHACENPVLLTYTGSRSWQPININPIHYNHTRYTLKLKNPMYISKSKY